MNEKDFRDFKVFAKDKGISSMNLYYANKQMKHYASITPYVIEERQMNITQLDVFSRLMMDRIIWLAGEVNDNMSVIAQSQLMFLDNINNDDINIQINSGGGSIAAGLGIINIMDYINSDVATVNMQLCASMGAVLLGAGEKGKRRSLGFSKTMIHMSSGGLHGTFADASISYDQWKKTNEQIFNLLGQYTNKDPEVIKVDANRDLWFDAQEALDYGLVDSIITKKQ